MRRSPGGRSIDAGPPDAFATVDRAALLLDVSEDRIREWVERGEVHAWETGGTCYVNLEEVIAYHARCRVDRGE